MSLLRPLRVPSFLGPVLLGLFLAPGLQGLPAGFSAAREQEEADAGSPRETVRGFLEACRSGDYDAAAVFLEWPADGGEEVDRGSLARHFKIILDRTVWLDLEAISADPLGDPEDGLAPQLERIATIERAKGTVDVLLRRATRADGTSWRFPASLVARIPTLYDEFGYGALGEVLPETLFRTSFLEIQLWQWIGMLLAVIAAYLLSWASVWVAYSALQPLVARTTSNLDDTLLQLTTKPVRVLLALAYFALGLLLLRLSVPVQGFLFGLQKGLTLVVLAWLFLRIVDIASAGLRARLQREGKPSAVAALPLGEKTLKVVVLGFACVAMMQNLGFNVTGLLAGLGVGGLALALAAQKTVENLFGGVSLIMDQPVRVGDFCRFGDKVGTVEDIGLRTTKIRTLDRTVVSVPNADFAYLQLENFARRDKIRFYTKLGLRYETTPDQLRWVLAEIRRLLLSHVRVLPDPARVRFVGYGDFSLDLEIFAFVSSTDINEYLGIQEDLLLRIMDIVNSSGTGFAFPSSTIYMARDGGKDGERTRQAEAKVGSLRAAGKLPFPDFTPELKAEIDDTIEYPPRESVLTSR